MNRNRALLHAAANHTHLPKVTRRLPCPKCGKLLVPPTGPDNAKVLVAGDFPGVEEVQCGVPFVGKVGEILRMELQRVGLNLYSFRAANLWQHAKGSPKGNFRNMDDKTCIAEWHRDELAKEFIGKTHVLLMGSDICKTFFGKGIMDLSGLEQQHPLFPKVRFFLAPIPPYLGPVGEFRLSIKRFAEALHV